MRNWRSPHNFLHYFWQYLLLFGLSLTLTILPACSSSSPPKPFVSEVSPTEPIAKIVEIQDRPVWVKFLNSSTESSAVMGTALKAGETLRTESSARVQVLLNSGIAVRIEGNTTLTLKPDNQMSLESGQMIAWVSPDKKLTAQIETPLAVVLLDDGTAYIDTPKDMTQDMHIFAMQGKIEVKPKNESTSITLSKGQDLTIKPFGKALEPVALDQKSIEQRFAKSPLLYGFNNKLENLASIEADLQISSNFTETKKVPYKDSEQAANNNKPAKPRESTPQVTYSRSEESSGRYREPEPAPAQREQPSQPSASRSEPVLNDPPPAPVQTISEPPPQPVQTVSEPPPQPVQPEIAPAEPPPLPVQPEPAPN